MTWLAAPAWMAMMPMLCATMSCNSRVIRSRSAITASATSCDRSATACSRRWRLNSPPMHAAAVARRAITTPDAYEERGGRDGIHPARLSSRRPRGIGPRTYAHGEGARTIATHGHMTGRGHPRRVDPVIEVDELTKRCGGRTAVDRLPFSV